MMCIDKGDLAGRVFLDFRKTFDLVDHSILIEKMTLYKCNRISHSRQQVMGAQGFSKHAKI